MQLNHFIQNGAIYKSKRIGFVALFVSLIIFAFALYIVIENLQKGDLFNPWYWLFFIAIGLFQLHFFAQEIQIDGNKKTITKSYFGLFKKEIKISEIKSFTLLEHVALGFIHNGTDIIINLQNGTQIKVLERIGKSKNVKTILAEMQDIIHNFN